MMILSEPRGYIFFVDVSGLDSIKSGTGLSGLPSGNGRVPSLIHTEDGQSTYERKRRADRWGIDDVASVNLGTGGIDCPDYVCG
jgi:hypothetical protein